MPGHTPCRLVENRMDSAIVFDSDNPNRYLTKDRSGVRSSFLAFRQPEWTDITDSDHFI